jgi:long-chain acyl-CoA synthetase
LIIRGGANISPFEIDEVLKQIAGVEIGIAVGFENDWYGEEVGAYVVLKEGTELSEEQILKLCQKRIPFAMAPKVVIIGKEIPVTSTGRYERSHLKGLFAPHKETQFSEKR